MTDEATTGADSRRARLAGRRHYRVRVASVAVAVAVVAGAAGVAAFALTGGNPLDTTAAIAHRDGFGKGKELPELDAAAKLAPPRPLSHAAPLRLWVGGDSLAGSLGPALGDLVGATGVVATQIDYKVSSGLASNDVRNWYARAAQQMTAARAEAVAFIIGTNDAPIVNSSDANRDGVPDWEAPYRDKVARLMDLLVGGAAHRTVFWIGAPTLRTKSMDAAAVSIDRVMRQEAEKRAPDIVYVDAYRLFSGDDGKYSDRLTDDTGRAIRVRIADGVHFTEAGAQYLARAIFTLVDARWHVQQQADPADPIAWTLAKGSGEAVPGIGPNPTPHVGRRTAATTAPTSITTPTSHTSRTTTPSPTSSTTPTTHSGPTTTAPASSP